ncbi:MULTISPECIES: isochorismatase family cysteine hydrolase [Streptomyces]|uniref:isochorismatase family cysteine hydrolase n=1 Tax=Streptomyces TaxID=1883 RepID=UPI0002DDDD2F|nr:MULTISPECIES: isochorismatase family cysteine hydrolase [Streptomyces]MCX4486819.1 cysteine hydrolase [Streptomyces anulatus]MCX4502491.1 cysteine hydrolase [Streptomyces anulatus]MCX4523070.1 cysteine hydrolase [Streptomyces anulatus]MCX4606081.1 cysteine hydrolase [Streptomyces anulatus]OKI55000.1 isochorismatase [Streptomyces sp. CB00072]
MPKVAVLTNDLQYDLVNKDEDRKAVVYSVIPKLAAFLDTLRSLDVAVVHLQLINRADDPRAERYDGWLPATEDSPGNAVLSEIVAEGDIMVRKHQASGFFETDLDERLREAGVTDLIVVGMHTQICVQTTAADGFFRGYNIVVPREGVISMRQADVQRALDWIASFCGGVSDMEDVINRVRTGRLHELMPNPAS